MIVLSFLPAHFHYRVEANGQGCALISRDGAVVALVTVGASEEGTLSLHFFALTDYLLSSETHTNMREAYAVFFHRVTGNKILPYQQRYGQNPFAIFGWTSKEDSLGVVLANDEGKQEHYARRDGQHYKRVDVGEGHRLPRHESVKQTVSQLGFMLVILIRCVDFFWKTWTTQMSSVNCTV